MMVPVHWLQGTICSPLPETLIFWRKPPCLQCLKNTIQITFPHLVISHLNCLKPTKMMIWSTPFNADKKTSLAEILMKTPNFPVDLLNETFDVTWGSPFSRTSINDNLSCNISQNIDPLSWDIQCNATDKTSHISRISTLSDLSNTSTCEGAKNEWYPEGP